MGPPVSVNRQLFPPRKHCQLQTAHNLQADLNRVGRVKSIFYYFGPWRMNWTRLSGEIQDSLNGCGGIFGVQGIGVSGLLFMKGQKRRSD